MGSFTYNDAPNMGFTMEFDNGYSISVQWSGVNYCSNRFKQYAGNNSVTAELMVIDSQGNEQEPIGWITADEVAKKIQETASIKTSAKWTFDFV